MNKIEFKSRGKGKSNQALQLVVNHFKHSNRLFIPESSPLELIKRGLLDAGISFDIEKGYRTEKFRLIDFDDFSENPSLEMGGGKIFTGWIISKK